MRERHKKAQQNIGAWAVIGLCLAGMGAFGMSAVMRSDDLEMKKNGCIAEGLPGTAVIVDYSPPLWGPTQERALREYFSLLFQDRLNGNERVTIYGTKGNSFSGVPKATLAMCKPVQSSAEAVQVGGQALADPYLKNKTEKAFKKMYWPQIETLLSTRLDDKEIMKDSPILELVQSMSRVPELTGRPYNRLVVISDMIQNADQISFCYKDRIPSFQKFVETANWRRLQPTPLTGVEVEVLMLGRESQKLNCTGDELAEWWKAFFLKSGAKVKIIRLREGL